LYYLVWQQTDPTSDMMNLTKPIDELDLPTRSHHCLKNANIRTLAELVVKTEADLLKSKIFGRRSLNEIKEVLAGLGLSLRNDDEDSALSVRRPSKPLQPSSGARRLRLKDD
jgi:DNA-directed RNA polymerase subunit alpha